LRLPHQRLRKRPAGRPLFLRRACRTIASAADGTQGGASAGPRESGPWTAPPACERPSGSGSPRRGGGRPPPARPRLRRPPATRGARTTFSVTPAGRAEHEARPDGAGLRRPLATRRRSPANNA